MSRIEPRSLGDDPAYDTPGDLRSVIRSTRYIAFSLLLLLAAAAVPLPVPGLWGELFVLLWAATLAGALWGGWRAGTAVLLLLVGTLFNLPLILGEGGARYVVWGVGSRVLPMALSAWMAGWLIRSRGSIAMSVGLLRLATYLLLTTATATAVAFWLQRGDGLELLPLTALTLALASIPAALLVRAIQTVGAPPKP